MSGDIQYPEHFIERLHIIWGEGFLSPGGPEEVNEIVRGLDLAGKTALDIGFGTGGPAITLARDHGLAKVVGIDIEPQLRDRAIAHAEHAGVADRIDFQIVTPGRLPFDDDSFDLVFSKDSLIHIEDKPGLFADVIRVLKPGGVFAASDWLAGSDAAALPALDRYREIGHLAFEMATAAQMEDILKAAGFDDVTTRDRNAWFADLCRHEMQQIEGPLKPKLVEAVGAELVEHWIGVRRAMSAAVIEGGLRPTHLRGVKPHR